MLVSQVKAWDERCDAKACHFCTQPFARKDIVRMMQCECTFHHNCIDMWFVKNSFCPKCQTEYSRPGRPRSVASSFGSSRCSTPDTLSSSLESDDTESRSSTSSFNGIVHPAPMHPYFSSYRPGSPPIWSPEYDEMLLRLSNPGWGQFRFSIKLRPKPTLNVF